MARFNRLNWLLGMINHWWISECISAWWLWFQRTGVMGAIQKVNPFKSTSQVTPKKQCWFCVTVLICHIMALHSWHRSRVCVCVRVLCQCACKLLQDSVNACTLTFDPVWLGSRLLLPSKARPLRSLPRRTLQQQGAHRWVLQASRYTLYCPHLTDTWLYTGLYCIVALFLCRSTGKTSWQEYQNGVRVEI